MGVSGNNGGNSKRKSLRSKVVTKKVTAKGLRSSTSSASTMKPLSDIKEFLYKQNAKSKTETADKDKKVSIVDQTRAMVTLKNGEKVALKNLSKSFKKRFNKRLRSSQENKLLSLDKITDELVNIKQADVISNNNSGSSNIFSGNPFADSTEQTSNNHQPKLNTKKGSKLIHIKETENFKKLLPTLSSSGNQNSDTFKNIKEIIKLRNQNGF